MVKRGIRAGFPAVTLACLLAGATLYAQQQSVPDAPAPQPDSQSNGLGDLRNQVAPGKASAPDAPADAPIGTVPAPPPVAPPPPPQQEPPDIPAAGQAATMLLHQQVNFVLVPVTVRDSKHQLVSGLTWRDFQVLENGRPQNIRFFTVDPLPLSVAFIIDQSVSTETMSKVNESLRAITGNLSSIDDVAVFTYNKFVEMPTTFTSAQGARLPAVLARVQRPGRDIGGPAGGPLAQGPIINGKQVDPNLAPQRGNASLELVAPKEDHPLNDAILKAATELAKTEKGRRRIIYVISDGREYGSKASQKEVIRYLLTNNISVYGTLVGEAATWGYGYLDKFHIPLLPSNNVLPKYTLATGGGLEAEFSSAGIQRSMNDITASIRTQYLIGYYTHEPFIDGKRRTIEVRTPGRVGLDITAKDSYYPSALEARQ